MKAKRIVVAFGVGCAVLVVAYVVYTFFFPGDSTDEMCNDTTSQCKVPALPAGVFIQLFFCETGVTHRLAENGIYRITLAGRSEEVANARSIFEPGSPEVTPEGLERLRSAVGAARFFSLPACLTIAPGPWTEGAPVKLPGGNTFRLQPIALTIREGEETATVQVRAEPLAPATFGPLEPLYRALDKEVLGGWMNE